MSGGEHDLSGAGATNGFHPDGGNYGHDSHGECGVPAAKRFHMPDNGNLMFWYSFEMGLAHHTVISSEHDFTVNSTMYAWLEADLQAVDRAKTPWLFLHLHRSMYCSEDYAPDYNMSKIIRAALEPLLAKYRVDVVFSGHYHAYERTCPVLQETCRSTPIAGAANGLEKALAPVHIMVGSAGAELDDAEFMDVPWSASAKLEYGYGRMHVYNASHARFEFLEARPRNVSDVAWIISDHNWS